VSEGRDLSTTVLGALAWLALAVTAFVVGALSGHETAGGVVGGGLLLVPLFQIAAALGARIERAGSLDGHSFSVKAGVVEVAVTTARSMTLGRRELEEIASGVASRRTGSLAVSREIREAVQTLLASGDETILFIDRDAVRFEGYARGPLEPVVRALLRLAGPGFLLTRHAGPSLCPFCKEAVSEAERHACEKCGSEHHRECYEEHGGCAIYGCERAPSSRRVRESRP
jgi:hypothetical protein